MRTFLALVLLSALLLSTHAPAQGAENADCLIDQGPCTVTAAGRQVAFEISPRPVRMMKELTFAIRATGRDAAPALLLDLSMPGMYMGRNEVVLKKTSDGTYRGKGIIPRCPSGAKLWRAEVSIPGTGKVSYTFNVNR
ncbi:MAG: hypothetical protein HZB62_15025 [Nitrospirae bacterium]|nr:hypothetical protein [Nitrospirota bacterium]